MPLQLSEFTDLPLLFIILEPCHYNFKILRNMPLHTPSTCFSKFMDQNTPAFFFLSSPPSFLSLYTAGSLLVPPPLSRGGAPAGRRARGAATGPRDGTVEPLHRRRPPSRLPTFLPGAPARWPWRAGGHSCGGPARGGRPTEASSLVAAGQHRLPTSPPPLALLYRSSSAARGVGWRGGGGGSARLLAAEALCNIPKIHKINHALSYF